jgi:hypothetical protein
MANSFVLLMILTIEYGWGIAPIKGNPFFNEQNCLDTIKDIKKLNSTRFNNLHYIKIECVTRKKNYLERKNNESLYKNNTAVGIF